MADASKKLFESFVTELSQAVVEINLDHHIQMAVKITSVDNRHQQVNLMALDLVTPVGFPILMEFSLGSDEKDKSKPRLTAKLSTDKLPVEGSAAGEVNDALLDLPFIEIDFDKYGLNLVFEAKLLDKNSLIGVIQKVIKAQQLIDSFPVRIQAVVDEMVKEIKALS